MRALLRGGALLALGLLSACASLRDGTNPAGTSPAVDAAWTARQQLLRASPGFQATGRVAVKGGGLSGALRWQQEGEHFSLRIAGPFGAGALSMEGTPQSVAIKGKDIDLVTDDPQQVLAQHTGWRLPLASLRWWVLGLPDPASEADVTLDDTGRALALQQQGWTLRYADYRGEGSSALPYRIEAVLPTTAGDWMATVVLQAISLAP